MFSKALRRAVASLLVLSLLGGCAEIDRRGGLVDQIEDYVLFRADTKSHRLWRSYLLIGVLLAAARRDPRNEIDQGAIEGNLVPALAIANEAFYCLYPGTKPEVTGAAVTNLPREIPDNWTTAYSIAQAYDQPRWCQFFDERMARLDYAIYRLAATTLFSAEGRKYLSDVRDRLIGTVPVFSDGVRAAIHANKALNQATTLVDDLLNLTFKSLGPSTALLPLYRDSLELNMVVVINTLQLRCAAEPGAERERYQPTSSSSPAPGVVLGYAADSDCDALRYALSIFNRGNGDLRLWREFIRNFNGHTQTVEAYRPHFLLVSQLLVRSCKVLLATGADPNRCKERILKDALEQSAFAIDNENGTGVGPSSGTYRQLTASLFPTVQTASTRLRTRIVRPASSAPDVPATGSIPPRSPAPAGAQPVAPSPATPAR